MRIDLWVDESRESKVTDDLLKNVPKQTVTVVEDKLSWQPVPYSQNEEFSIFDIIGR